MYFCDKTTIRKNGVISRMWDLMEHSIVQTHTGLTYMSAKSLQAYNCREETSTIISIILYSGSMGKGNVVYTYTWQESEWKWSPVAPDSIYEVLWKIACGKK
jgi:hypothetical protein